MDHALFAAFVCNALKSQVWRGAALCLCMGMYTWLSQYLPLTCWAMSVQL
jgi:hypothetical protein